MSYATPPSELRHILPMSYATPSMSYAAPSQSDTTRHQMSYATQYVDRYSTKIKKKELRTNYRKKSMQFGERKGKETAPL